MYFLEPQERKREITAVVMDMNFGEDMHVVEQISAMLYPELMGCCCGTSTRANHHTTLEAQEELRAAYSSPRRVYLKAIITSQTFNRI